MSQLEIFFQEMLPHREELLDYFFDSLQRRNSKLAEALKKLDSQSTWVESIPRALAAKVFSLPAGPWQDLWSVHGNAKDLRDCAMATLQYFFADRCTPQFKADCEVFFRFESHPKKSVLLQFQDEPQVRVKDQGTPSDLEKWTREQARKVALAALDQALDEKFVELIREKVRFALRQALERETHHLRAQLHDSPPETGKSA
jgi:hypothetical protein